MLSPQEICEQAKKLYWENERCDADHKVATLLYEAATSGCAEAMFLIDFWDLYYWCQGTQTRPSYWLRKAAELGEVRANRDLAKSILTDKWYCETNGIETVREEALSLLRDAANAGISSAAYCLCDRLRENYSYILSADNLAEYAYAVKARASLHEEAGDMASAIRYYKFALDIYKDISNLYRNQNKMPDAKKYLLDALSLLETIVTKRTDAYKNNQIDTGTKELLTQDANEISSIVIDLQEIHCEKVIDKTTIAQRTVNFFARMAQILPAVYNPLYGMHCFNLAELLYDTKKFTEAEHAYLLAISIYEKCIPDNPAYHFSVAESYNNLAVMYHDNEQYDKAEAMHRKALEVRQYCASEWSSKYADKVLALSYMNLGILLFDIKQYEESEQMYLYAVDLYTKVENFYSVAKLHVRLGDLYRVMKQPLESASHFHAAIGVCEQNMASNPEGFTPILADAHDGLSFLYEKEGDLARSAKEATAAKEAALHYPTYSVCKRILKRNCY